MSESESWRGGKPEESGRGMEQKTMTRGEDSVQAWQGLLQEATDALVRMDADRLEELARCCADLNRQMQGVTPPSGTASSKGHLVSSDHAAFSMRGLEQQLSAQRASMAVMARLLAETRANLRVLTRLHMLRLKAAESLHPDVWHSRPAGVDYGDN